jgi:long-chain acyl-CoA synthetase
MEKQLVAHCRKDLIKWSCPRDIEFRDNLPLTLIGKVAYKVLEDEEIEKLNKNNQYAGE